MQLEDIMSESKIIFKRRRGVRRLILKVNPLTLAIELTLPWWVTYAEGRSFVLKNKDWIENKLNDYTQKANHKKNQQFILGQPYRINHLDNSQKTYKAKLDKENGIIYVISPLELGLEGVTQSIRMLQKEILYEFVLSTNHYWEEKMSIHPELSLYVKYMKSQWGNCRPRLKKITLSTELCAFNHEVIEYVWVHELAHIRFANHGKEFKALLDKVMPDWRVRSAQLKTQY